MRMVRWPTLVLVFGCVLAAVFGCVLASVFTDDLPGLTTTSTNPSGAQCPGDSSQQCVSEATCTRQGTCSCPLGKSGHGHFHCYFSNSVHTQISGLTNTLTTFHHTSLRLVWPCRFRLTEFRTGGKTTGRDCHFQVFGVNKVVGGRIALVGMEVHFGLIRDDSVATAATQGIGIRTVGTLRQGLFTYIQWGRNEFIKEDPVTFTEENVFMSFDGSGSGNGDGSEILDEESSDFHWGHLDELTGVEEKYLVNEVDEDNFAALTIAECGVDIRFRATDVTPNEPNQTPGLSLTVSKQNGPIRFIRPTTYLAETAETASLQDSARDRQVSPTQAALHRSMAYAAEQYHSPEGDVCEETAQTYRLFCETVDSKRTALTKCSFLLEDSGILSCMDSSKERVQLATLKIFNLCIWNSCSPSSYLCKLLQSQIQQAGCMQLMPPELRSMNCQ